MEPEVEPVVGPIDWPIQFKRHLMFEPTDALTEMRHAIQGIADYLIEISDDNGVSLLECLTAHSVHVKPFAEPPEPPTPQE